MEISNSVSGKALLGFVVLISIFVYVETAEQRKGSTLHAKSPAALVEHCSSIIVGKKASADGSVIFAHNEDLENYTAHHYIFQQHLSHKPGEIVTTYGGAKVPQVAETFAYTATKIFDKNYSPGDITSGINEYQVAVANDVMYRREVPQTLPTEGRLIWTEFTQLALERAKTAKEAVRIIGDLVHTYKLGVDSGAVFAVTDPNEGWWVEVTLEGQWVAQRVPDNAAEMRANIFRIGVVDFKDSSNFMYSDDLVDYAKNKGWYDGKGPFHFAKTYAAPEKLDDPYNTRRQERAEELLRKQSPKLTPAHIMAILRDHYEGTPFDLTNGYKKGSPHQTDERTLCSINTEVSVVCQSRSWLPAEIGAICWRAMATPCTSVYTPWYFGSREVPPAYQTGTNEFTKNSAYWTFRDLSRYADVRYRTAIGKIRKDFGAFEKKEFDSQGKVEKTAVELYSKDKNLARQYLTKYSKDMARQAMEMGSFRRN